MPTYKIYAEHLVSVIFEVEARSKIDAEYKWMAARFLEEAAGKWKTNKNGTYYAAEDPENDFKKQLVHVGETEYTPTHKIVIERKRVVNNANI